MNEITPYDSDPGERPEPEDQYCALCDENKPVEEFKNNLLMDQRPVCEKCLTGFQGFLKEFSSSVDMARHNSSEIQEPTISWKDDIDPFKLNRFYFWVTAMSRYYFGTDDEGDTTVAIKFINRAYGYSYDYVQLPYRDRSMTEAAHAFECAQLNLSMAQSDFDRVWRIFKNLTLEPLRSGKVMYDSESAAKHTCPTCRGSYDVVQRRDDGSWWHYEGSDQTESRLCLAQNFHEAEYLHRMEVDKTEADGTKAIDVDAT